MALGTASARHRNAHSSSPLFWQANSSPASHSQMKWTHFLAGFTHQGSRCLQPFRPHHHLVRVLDQPLARALDRHLARALDLPPALDLAPGRSPRHAPGLRHGLAQDPIPDGRLPSARLRPTLVGHRAVHRCRRTLPNGHLCLGLVPCLVPCPFPCQILGMSSRRESVCGGRQTHCSVVSLFAVPGRRRSRCCLRIHTRPSAGPQ
jgi:hypothetical protein